MGSEQFNQDLAASKKLAINGVSKVRRGDSDGEVVFTWTPNDDTSPMDIQVLILDVDSYPKGSSVLIFTGSEHSSPDVASLLERISESLANKNIQTIIETAAEKLSTKPEAGAHASESAIVACGEDSGEEDEWETNYEDYSDVLFEIACASSKSRITNNDGTAPSVARLKKELRIVQAAGISIGIFPRKSVKNAEFFSLSLRVKKLGIPEHALEAWGLERSEYLVLLCRFPASYLPISELMDSQLDDDKLQFRFGKCSKPKPSIDTARRAFAAPSDEAPESQDGPCEEAKDGSGSFVPLYVSNSINMLMNNHFMALLKMRRRDGLAWDGALRRLHPGSSNDPSPPAAGTEAGASEASEAIVSENAMPSLSHDYALDDGDKFSLPMTAMQFALRHLARCTKYCMVCHQRVEDGFEALKPYVCSNPLCNYQFLNLGLGASIEHEIVGNPYVVDILISFFAIALTVPKSLRNFPAGLNIKSIFTGNKTKEAIRIAAEACFVDKTIRFGLDLKKADINIKVGDRLMIVFNTSDTLPVPAILDGHYERHICKVTKVACEIYTFEVIATFTGPLKKPRASQEETPTQLSDPKQGWQKVMILRYTCEIDRLNELDRTVALAMVLHEIPSVLDMRSFLLKNPGQRLTSWGRLDKPALILLQWIISSNRSLILQNDAVPRQREGGHAISGKADPNPNRVEGLPPQWMQFRFLQGTPERERIFTSEIATLSKSEGDTAKFPTIFAWHGSALHNWHSIIRTGLDFNKVLNGRSFGDGVYMSSNFQVSLAYSRRGANLKMTGLPPVTYWPNSVLRPSSAISICEVVNRCDQFVATKPHYVVKQIEWIQCRYLFVCVTPNAEALQEPFPTKPREPCAGYVAQHPPRKLLAGPNNEVKIPLSAILSNRQLLGHKADGAVDGSELAHTQETEAESPDSDHGETDHELLLDSEDDDSVAARSNKRRSSSIDSADHRRPKLSSAEFSKKMPKENAAVNFETDFVPGSLDLDSLPRLPEPSWASTSPMAIRTLNRSIKELHDIQSKEDLASLGWYINFDKLENVFHWTVEMHSFDPDLPLAKDMKERGCTSIVLEFRFGSNFPYSPPFVRVIRPRFLPFMRGGGGHVTAGGAICSEMLTNSGWSAAMTMEKVLLQIRLGLTELDPPARLEMKGVNSTRDYGIGEAVDAYQRAATRHGWQIPKDLKSIGSAWTSPEQKKGE
ncbi:Ubiquitin-conjugating enzyme E2Q-like protein [Trichoderma ghanense]|uniref:Ubiquitin-conjugating enzyme E2Q-like protein n=1 Tax=Trichoderma ghanense TaxID=65468 RepID=A0ABY2HA04_9HYPO